MMMMMISIAVLVDQPENVRVFERVQGLEVIVNLLKNRDINQKVRSVRLVILSHLLQLKRKLVLRMKTLELLYFYLLPEENPEEESKSPTEDFEDLTLSNLQDFVPKTPKRHTTTSTRLTKVKNGRKTRTVEEKKQSLSLLLANVENLISKFHLIGNDAISSCEQKT
jgi:hypothetical protein